MPNNSVPAADDGLPEDKRSELSHLLDDVHDLLRMASINTVLIDHAFSFDRAVKRRGRTVTFNFAQQWVDDLDFVAHELERRAARLWRRRNLIDPDSV